MSTRSDTPSGPAAILCPAFQRGVVEEVLDGRSLTEALADVDGALRPAVQAVSFHAMRYLGWADAVGRELVQRYPNVLFESLLLVSLTLLKAEGEAAAAVPGMPVYAPHTVVDQAVTAASKARALAAFKGLLNGCLRRFLREREALAAAVADSPEAQWNHPGWWVKQLRVAYPQHWQAILQAANLPAPLTLRVNRRRASREQVLAAFQDAGLAAEPVGAAGLVVATPRPVVQLPGFAEGWWSVQDAGAQRAAELLAPADGMRVLDACAARRQDRPPAGAGGHRPAGPGRRRRSPGAGRPEPGPSWPGRRPGAAAGRRRRRPGRLVGRQALRRRAGRRAVHRIWHRAAPSRHPLAAPRKRPAPHRRVADPHPGCPVAHRGAGRAPAVRDLLGVPDRGHAPGAGIPAAPPEARRLDAPGQLLPVAVDATPAEQQDGFFYALFAKPS